MRTGVWLFIFCIAAFGQARPAFEVATVKPAGPATGWTTHVGIEGGPGTSDPGRISYSHLNLKYLLWTTYNVTSFQISGPAWLETERYDIVATVPRGASKEQVTVMLQDLLADRFNIVLHHETKDLPAYVLLIGSKGAKLKPSEEEGEPPKENATPFPPGYKPHLDKYGFPNELSPGLRGRTSMIKLGGKLRLTADKVSMERLAIDWLASDIGRVVVDMTGLKGTYDFTLTFLPQNGSRIPVTSDYPAPPDIFGALQEQLGLKLESRKLPIDVLVVDRANKVPTGN